VLLTKIEKRKEMLCPYCFNDETKVIDKRDADGMTRRRRECLKCAKRFNTREHVEKVELRVIKKNGQREDFDREKIKKGIMRACEKRPISNENIEKMIMKIEEKLRRKGKEIKTSGLWFKLDIDNMIPKQSALAGLLLYLKALSHQAPFC